MTQTYDSASGLVAKARRIQYKIDSIPFANALACPLLLAPNLNPFAICHSLQWLTSRRRLNTTKCSHGILTRWISVVPEKIKNSPPHMEPEDSVPFSHPEILSSPYVNTIKDPFQYQACMSIETSFIT
jgi:hypothetical protein